MRFLDVEIDGAKIIEIEPLGDERGFFARCWCPDEFAEAGVPMSLAQASVAFTRRRGTLRGLHYQAAPHEEDKLVRCTRGAAFVAVADLRPGSPTYLNWAGVELSADNRRSLYVPKGCAQGYQTLADETEMFYQMSEFYQPGAKRGVRFDDPAFNIEWPLDVSCTADADRSWPNFESPCVSVT